MATMSPRPDAAPTDPPRTAPLAGSLGSRLRRAAPGLAVAAVAVAMLHAAVQAPPTPPRPMPCARAGMVDRLLRCDEELPADPAALCGAARPRAHEPIAAGDALETAQLCARSEASPGADGHGWGRMAPDDLAALEQPVDLNLASPAELESLPRVGPALAQRIVAARPFADVDALLRVRGIGPATLAKLRGRVVVRGRAP